MRMFYIQVLYYSQVHEKDGKQIIHQIQKLKPRETRK